MPLAKTVDFSVAACFARQQRGILEDEQRGDGGGGVGIYGGDTSRPG